MQFKEYLNTGKIGIVKKTKKKDKEDDDEKVKASRKNFYNFREIVRIDDFQTKHSDSPQNANILRSFQNSLKEQFLLRKFGRQVKPSLREQQLYSNGVKEEEKSREQTDVSEQMQLLSSQNLNHSKFNVLKVDDKVYFDVNFNILNGSQQQNIVQKIDQEQLRKKFMEKYQDFIRDNRYDNEEKKRHLEQEYRRMMTQMSNRRYMIVVPQDYSVQAQDYNDYYRCNRPQRKVLIKQEQFIDSIVDQQIDQTIQHHDQQNQLSQQDSQSHHEQSQHHQSSEQEQQSDQQSEQQQEQQQEHQEQYYEEDYKIEQIDHKNRKQVRKTKKSKQVQKKQVIEQRVQEAMKKFGSDDSDSIPSPIRNVTIRRSVKQVINPVQATQDLPQEQKVEEKIEEKQIDQSDQNRRKSKKSYFEFNTQKHDYKKDEKEEDEDQRKKKAKKARLTVNMQRKPDKEVKEEEEEEEEEKPQKIEDMELIRRKTIKKMQQKQEELRQEEEEKQQRLQQLVIHNDTDNTDSELDENDMIIDGYGRARNTVVLDKLLDAQDLFDLNLNEFFEKKQKKEVEVPEDIKFENEEDRMIFNEIYIWKRELSEEIEEDKKEFIKEKKRIAQIFDDIDADFLQNNALLNFSDSESEDEQNQ